MEFLRLLCLVSLAVPSVSGQGCPGNADECIRHSGFNAFSNDISQICTVSERQLMEAGTCMSRCNYPLPSHFNDQLNYLQRTCSATEECAKKYKAFGSCYDSQASLSHLIEDVLKLFNFRLPYQESCLKLRSIRACMKTSGKGCYYLENYFKTTISNMKNFDLALYVCGAENVESTHYNDQCSQQVYRNIEGACNVACQLSSATTAGDFCNILQSQVTCIEGYSRRCDQARTKLLLPRIDTYSFVNNIFRCNISSLGMLVKPIEYNGCDFKMLLTSCFNIETEEKMTFMDVQKYVNGDIFAPNFCSNVENKQHHVDKCVRAYWPCMTPLSRAFQKPSSFEDFSSNMGTFPLNSLGLEHAYESCALPPNYRPSMICKNPAYNVARTTTLPPNIRP